MKLTFTKLFATVFCILLILINPRTTNAQSCWKAIAKGPSAEHTVAIAQYGTLWSWGSNAYGQLGDGFNIITLLFKSLLSIQVVFNDVFKSTFLQVRCLH